MTDDNHLDELESAGIKVINADHEGAKVGVKFDAREGKLRDALPARWHVVDSDESIDDPPILAIVERMEI